MTWPVATISSNMPVIGTKRRKQIVSQLILECFNERLGLFSQTVVECFDDRFCRWCRVTLGCVRGSDLRKTSGENIDSAAVRTVSWLAIDNCLFNWHYSLELSVVEWIFCTKNFVFWNAIESETKKFQLKFQFNFVAVHVLDLLLSVNSKKQAYKPFDLQYVGPNMVVDIQGKVHFVGLLKGEIL